MIKVREVWIDSFLKFHTDFPKIVLDFFERKVFPQVVSHDAKKTFYIIRRGCSGGIPICKLSILLFSLLSMLVVTAINVCRVKPQTLETFLHINCVMHQLKCKVKANGYFQAYLFSLEDTCIYSLKLLTY